MGPEGDASLNFFKYNIHRQAYLHVITTGYGFPELLPRQEAEGCRHQISLHFKNVQAIFRAVSPSPQSRTTTGDPRHGRRGPILDYP